MNNLRIATLNVRGLCDYGKRRQIFYMLHKHKFDIIYLQETHSESKDEKVWSSQWGSKIWFSNGTSSAKGTAILIDRKLEITIHNVEKCNSGRYVMLYCTIAKKKFLLANIYAPNTDDIEFMTEFTRKVENFTPDYYVVAGDFNLVLDIDLDKQGQTNITHDKAAKILKQTMTNLSLIDIWRYYNPSATQYTWYRLKPRPTFARLDFFLISESFMQFLANCYHAIVELICDFTTCPKGPGYWKPSTQLLHDADYVEKNQ